jgi:protein Mpv17
MKTFSNILLLLGMQLIDGFVAIKSTIRQIPDSKQPTMAAMLPSSEVAIESPCPEKLVLEASVVDKAAKSGFKAEQILGVSTATAIFSFLLLSHSDTSIAQSTAVTLQHLFANLITHTWGTYETALNENPIATKSVTSATVYSIGDMIAQKTKGSENIDTARVLRSGLAGGIGHGPMSHIWYYASEEYFTNIIHLTEWWSFIPKIAVDQIIWGTIWNTSYIFLLGLMKSESFEKMAVDVKSTTLPLFFDGLKLWPLVHCVTYGLMPVEYRLVWVDLIEIIWVSILASKASTLCEEKEQFTNDSATIKI